MARYLDNIVDRNGNVVVGANILVTTPAGVNASLYSNSALTAPKGNPLTTDVNGEYDFYAAQGTYTLTISGPGITTRAITDVFVPDADVESAAASAASALASLNDFKGRWYGPLAADPALDPLGAAIGTGDAYFNTVSKLLLIYNGATWQASDINTAALAASGGAALVGSLQSGVGAATRTVQAKLRDIVSVKDFGALGDGVTDDTAAIQAAINSLGTTGGTVYLPPGQYKVTSTLTRGNNILIAGAGVSSSLVSTHAGSVIQGTNYTTTRSYSCGGRDFAIYGPGMAIAGSIALDLRGASLAIFSNVDIRNIETAVRQGGGYSSYYNEFHGCNLSGVTTGYLNDTLGNENKVFGGRVNDCTTGTSDSDCSGNRYVGLALEVFTTGHRTTGAAATNISYLCSRLENAPTSGVGFDINSNAQDVTIIAPQFAGLTTDISDSGIRTNIIASEYWRIGGGTRIKRHQSLTAAIDFPSIAAQTTNDQLVSVTGALATDSWYVTPNASVPAGVVFNAVPASGGVYVRAANITAGAIDMGSLTFTIDLWRHG